MEGRLVLLVAVLMVFAAPEKAVLLFPDNDDPVNITRAGCETTKLCVETPDDCDPAENQTCLFMSGIASPPTASGDTNLTIELSGQSSGYIAVALVANASEGLLILVLRGESQPSCTVLGNEDGLHRGRGALMESVCEGWVVTYAHRRPAVGHSVRHSLCSSRFSLHEGTETATVLVPFCGPYPMATCAAPQAATMGFICGQNPWDNDTFLFSTVEMNNTDGAITQTNVTVTEIQGLVEGNLIQCEFTILVTTTNFSVVLGNGTIDMTLGLGPFNVGLVSGPLDFTNPSSDNATVAPTTVTSHTPNGASGALQPHALLLLLSILPLSVLQKA